MSPLPELGLLLGFLLRWAEVFGVLAPLTVIFTVFGRVGVVEVGMGDGLLKGHETIY